MKNSFPQISVSILNSDLSNITKTLKILDRCKIRYIHLDVMDGNFVPNLTFGPSVIKSMRFKTKSIFDTHLMINSPKDSVRQYIDSGCDIITFHYESINKKNILELIDLIKNSKKKVGISIKPSTEPAKIIEYLGQIDLILIMTVEPGFGGQKIIECCLDKISFFDEYRKKKDLKYIISVDGGINEKNVIDIIKKGCDLPVVGNAIFGSKNIIDRIKLFQTLIK